MFDIETKIGDICFLENVINRIIAEAVKECDGKAEILNYKGKYMNAVPGIASKMNLYDEEAGGIQIKQQDDILEIDVYIVLKFGASIKKNTKIIIDYVYEQMEKIMNVKPNKVTVIVTGILSKNIAKRHIEVSR